MGLRARRRLRAGQAAITSAAVELAANISVYVGCTELPAHQDDALGAQLPGRQHGEQPDRPVADDRDILVLSIDNPPVNALTAEIRAGIVRGMAELAADVVLPAQPHPPGHRRARSTPMTASPPNPHDTEPGNTS